MKTADIARQVGLKVLGLVLSFGVGYVYNLWNPSSPAGLPWLVGGMVFLFLQMLELGIRVNQDTAKHQDTLRELSASMAREHAERVLIELGLAHADRDLTEGETTVVWRQLTWSTQSNYCATNYIEPESFYKSGHAQNVLQLQKTKLRSQPNFSLRKVLVWKDAAERDSAEARRVVALHLDDPAARMTLKGILWDQINQRPILRDPLRVDLDGQIDFGIFDDLVVLVWTLDAARAVKGGRVIVGATRVAVFRSFFDTLAQEADPLNA